LGRPQPSDVADRSAPNSSLRVPTINAA
jgi:hypothetical protein